MPVTLGWEQIALRLLLALAASFLIGYDRDEHGKTSGIRTIMLVCMAATLAMLQANLLLDTRGRASDSFIMMDLMRFPLGILSGIGFIGAGAILRKDGLVQGLTTAATLWFVTVLGLLFGGGQLKLALAGTAIALFILWVLKRAERHLPTRRGGSLTIEFAKPEASQESASPLTESELRQRLQAAGLSISGWTAQYSGTTLSFLYCELRWSCRGGTEPGTPRLIHELASSASVASLTWKS